MGDAQDRNQVYADAVSHGISGYYRSFATAATILRIARPELDSSVLETPTGLGDFFDLINTVEGSLSTVQQQHGLMQPFVVAVEGLDGSGKSTLVTTLAEALGGHACATPSASLMAVRPAMDKRGGAVARAFYMISNYVLQYEILQHPHRHAIFVVDRWFSSTCAYSIAWKNTAGGPEAIDALPVELFKWPKDLIPPQVQLLLHVDEEVRRSRVQSRAATDGVASTSRFNPWDQRLEDDAQLGQRILRAHQRSIGSEKVFVNADGTPSEVLEAALQLVRSRLERFQTPWKAFSQSPMQWFQWQASSQCQLCHPETGRRLHHAPWAIQIAVGGHMPPMLRSVGIHTANDEGILFYTWGKASGGMASTTNDDDDHTDSIASMVCLLGDYPIEQQWRAEGILVESTIQADQAMGIAPPSMLTAHVTAAAQLTSNSGNGEKTSFMSNQRPRCPSDYETSVESVQQQQQSSSSRELLLVATRFIPLRIEVLMGGPSSSGGPLRWEWSRGPYRCGGDDNASGGGDDDRGWTVARRILPFSPPRSISFPSVQLQPLTIVVLGTHCAGKRTVGTKLAQLLDMEFHPELGDSLRDVASLQENSHEGGYGSDWDGRVLQAEIQRDQEAKDKSRVVETWHVGNWAWVQSRNPDESTRSRLQEQVHKAIRRAGENSCILFVLLKVDPETCVRRRESDPANASRLPLSNPELECRRLHSYLQEKVQDMIPRSSCPLLEVDNSKDGDNAIQESCLQILHFVQRNQWRRAVQCQQDRKK